MIRSRARDTALQPSLIVDQATVAVAYQYLAWATVWLLVGTVAGLLAAIKLNWPTFLPLPWLSFGRIRPIHTNTVFWGWSTLALVGVASCVVSRTSRVPLWSPRLALIALWLWNSAALAGLVTLSVGWSTGPREYREWIWPLAFLLGAGVLLNGYNLYRTVGARRLPEVYISNWYILGAFCWLPILYLTAHLPFFGRGVSDVIVQGYYMHTAVGMWFTILAVGSTYYVLPRLLGHPIYSYSLGVLGFWTNMLFYTLIGAHHFIFSPVPYWLQTTAILFSVGMLVPVWAGTGNFILTFRGSWNLVRRSYALPFLLVGIIGYGLSSSQGTLQAFRTVNVYLHFTHFTVGHSHATMYGFIAFMIWGLVYGLMPRLTGREPYPVAVGVHFWLALVGVAIYVGSLSIAGALQGAAWVEGRSFISSIAAVEPLWLSRTVGGLLMAGSHVVFAVNVWAMRPAQRSSEEKLALPAPAGAPAMTSAGLHRNHRAIVALAGLGFATLTLIIVILPASQVLDTAPLPGATLRTAEEEYGRQIYLKEGCGFCHTQFLRDLPVDRSYGRASIAADYAREAPTLLGSERTGPDLINVGTRQPSQVWHLIHLYDPRAVVPGSVMPSYWWYFEVRASATTQEHVVAVPVTSAPAGKVVVAKREALALVQYLLSLRQVETRTER